MKFRFIDQFLPTESPFESNRPIRSFKSSSGSKLPSKTYFVSPNVASFRVFACIIRGRLESKRSREREGEVISRRLPAISLDFSRLAPTTFLERTTLSKSVVSTRKIRNTDFQGVERYVCLLKVVSNFFFILKHVRYNVRAKIYPLIRKVE